MWITSTKDGRGYRLLNKFATKLCSITMRNAYIFYERTKYAPFCFAERQFHSVLCPALFEITKSSLMEVPLDRKMLKKRTHKISRRRGWVDYTCKFGSRQVNFFLEIKHAWMNWANHSAGNDIVQKWHNSLSQLNSVKREIVGWSSNKEAIRVALMIVIHYTQERKDRSSRTKPEEHHNKIMRSLSFRKPNWDTLFIPESKFVANFQDEGYYYPAISCLAFAYKIQRF